MNETICLDNKKYITCTEETGFRGEIKSVTGNFKPLNLTLVTCNSCDLTMKTLRLKNEKQKKNIPYSREQRS